MGLCRRMTNGKRSILNKCKYCDTSVALPLINVSCEFHCQTEALCMERVSSVGGKVIKLKDGLNKR